MNSPENFDQQLLDLCKRGRKLNAIKLYMEEKDADMRTAKDYVDNLCSSHGIQTKSGGCFIATVCYGDYDATEVLILRQYREGHLVLTWQGRFFVKCYNTFSPFLARQLSKSEIAKRIVKRLFLQPLVGIIALKYPCFTNIQQG